MEIEVRDSQHCQECGRDFVPTDSIVSSLTNLGEGVVRQYWHEACWTRHRDEVARRKARSEES